MEILEGEALYRALLQRYSQDPRGWSFTVSQSPKSGFFDALVAGPDEVWQLKLDTVYKPSPLVLGSRTEQGQPSATPPPISFGFRRFDPREAPGLLDGSSQSISDLLTFLQSVNPVAPTGRGSYIQGPFLFANPGHVSRSLNGEQQTVDLRLSEEMLKLVRSRYPSYL